MTTENGAFSTASLELVKRELGGIREFYESRMNSEIPPLREEVERIGSQLVKLQDAGRQGEKLALLQQYGAGQVGGERPRVPFGKYAGMDHLDLACARSLLSAQLREPSGANPRMLEDWQSNLKAAMDSTTAGSGDELVDTQEARALWDDVNLETAIAPLFNTVQMPSNPFQIPLQLGAVNWYPGTENTAVTGSAPATARQTLTAHELVAEVPWSYDLDEDAVIAMMDELRRSLLRNAHEVIDDVILNGDRTAQNNINADGATITAATAGHGAFPGRIRRPAAPAAGGQHRHGQRPQRGGQRRHVQRDSGQTGQVRGAAVGTGLHHRRQHLHQVAQHRQLPDTGKVRPQRHHPHRPAGCGGRHTGHCVGADAPG